MKDEINISTRQGGPNTTFIPNENCLNIFFFDMVFGPSSACLESL